MPSWPSLSTPQQSVPADALSAHVNALPREATCVKSLDEKSTFTGVALSAVDRSPSWPKSLEPQQNAWPLARTAQLWYQPVATPTAPLTTALTATGV